MRRPRSRTRPAASLEVEVTAGDAADNSAPLFSQTYRIDPGEVVQLIALGVLDATPDDDSDDTPDEFTLLAAEAFAETLDPLAVRGVNGTPDAPAIDVLTRDGGLQLNDLLFNDLEYPSASLYVALEPDVYFLEVTTADGAPVPVGPFFVADLEDAAAGTTVTFLTSGFLDPSDDGPGAPGFGLLAVFADGTSALLPRDVGPDLDRGRPRGRAPPRGREPGRVRRRGHVRDGLEPARPASSCTTRSAAAPRRSSTGPSRRRPRRSSSRSAGSRPASTSCGSRRAAGAVGRTVTVVR